MEDRNAEYTDRAWKLIELVSEYELGQYHLFGYPQLPKL